MLERLERLRMRGMMSKPKQHEEAVRGYLSVINLMSCATEKWVLVGGVDGGIGEKRRLVTIEEVRKRYQDLLDEMSVIETGNFDFGLAETGETMDIL